MDEVIFISKTSSQLLGPSVPAGRGKRARSQDVMTPPMVGSTWPRVRSTLESDCFPMLSQGTALLCLIVDLLIAIFTVAVHIRCLVIGVVLVRRLSVYLCGPGGYTYDHMYVYSHGSLYPMMDGTLRV